jgi:hypothetical protein
MDKKAMYQMMGSRPMYAGQTNIVNPNNPNVPVEFQTGSYITPQPPSMVPPDPNSVTGLEMQTMPMQQNGGPGDKEKITAKQQAMYDQAVISYKDSTNAWIQGKGPEPKIPIYDKFKKQ